jgi:APA family basic amino acid/polyamine antiporter
MPGPELQRKLGLFPATNIVVSNMIGAGIFTTSGLLLAGIGNPLLMLILWAVGGIIAFCGALAYGELGAALPGAGGEYYFLSRLFHPALGFLSGWVSFVAGFSAPIAASALGFSEYFTRAVPGTFTLLTGIGAGPETAKKLLAIFVILLFTGIHYRGIKYGSRIQNLLTLLKVLLIIILLTTGFLSGKGDYSNITSGGSIPDGLQGFKTIGLSLMWIMFAYSGWNASTYIGAEIRNPGKTLPRSLLYGTVIVTLLYIGLNTLYLYAVSPDKMKGVISIGGLAMGNLFGKPGEVLFSSLIGFALFSSLSAYIIIGPRVYYSMSADGLFFRMAGRIHPRFGVPSNSILLQSLIAVIMVLSGTFEQVLTYMGFALGIFPIFTVLSVWKLRSSGQALAGMRTFPVARIIYILTGTVILILSFLERPAESSIALLTAVSGIPVYLIFRRITGDPRKQSQDQP